MSIAKRRKELLPGLNEIRTYLALLSYPAIVVFIFDWWSEGSRWAREHSSFSVPADLQSKDERTGRILLFLKYSILFFALRLLAGRYFWRIVSVRFTLVLIGQGIIGGLLAFAYRRLLVLIYPAVARKEKHDYLLRGPSSLWLMILATGAFAEELWMALCILAFRQNGYSAISAVLLLAFAFTCAHVGGLPSRIPGGLENAAAEIGIGVIFGVLITWTGSVVPALLANMIYYMSHLFSLRRHYSYSPLPN